MSDKTPCQYCGKEITVQAYGRKKHEDACKMNPVNEKKTEDKVGENKIEKKSEAQLKAEELFRISQKAQESRKESPELFVGSSGKDVRKELVFRYASECVPPAFNPKTDKVRRRAEWHSFFGSKDKARLHAHRGYEPVLNEHREQVTHEGDLLWRIPTEMWKQGKAVSEQESKGRLKASSKEMKDLKEGNSVGKTGGDVSERKETTTEVVQI